MTYNNLCTYNQAVALKRIGFSKRCNHYYWRTSIDSTPNRAIKSRNPKNHNLDLCNRCTYTIVSAPSLHNAAKWLREEWGIDIVISPRFDSSTGDRIGYFWRWSQRTEVNMNPKIHKSYEAALCDAISTVLDQFNVT